MSEKCATVLSSHLKVRQFIVTAHNFQYKNLFNSRFQVLRVEIIIFISCTI
jgi:hypothetical protein